MMSIGITLGSLGLGNLASFVMNDEKAKEMEQEIKRFEAAENPDVDAFVSFLLKNLFDKDCEDCKKNEDCFIHFAVKQVAESMRKDKTEDSDKEKNAAAADNAAPKDAEKHAGKECQHCGNCHGEANDASKTRKPWTAGFSKSTIDQVRSEVATSQLAWLNEIEEQIDDANARIRETEENHVRATTPEVADRIEAELNSLKSVRDTLYMVRNNASTKLSETLAFFEAAYKTLDLAEFDENGIQTN